ncbi:MAG TPA: TAT-variant-translocated molybdopterin oxidoreductase [Chthoniobacterales bacterium]|nr:TAT-variant-translocated molybdopterin oxidoreductase [Chthoniobacterales bacterium]
MKRIFPHPPREENPTLWRSAGERENQPEFVERLQREFPAGADRLDQGEQGSTNGLSRRDFLKLTGASAALAGIGLTACRRPEAYLVPFTRSAEWTIPGKFLYYATTMPTPLGAIPVIATTSDGRPTKIEGNPLHPISNGSTDAFAQASILGLYDPHRSKEITYDGKKVKKAEFNAYLARVREVALTNGGEGIVVLSGRTNSPTHARLQAALAKEFPKILWVEYEALSRRSFDQACDTAFGLGNRPVYHFKKADVILALDSDFLNPAETAFGFARGFYPRRNPDQAMNRLYAVENHYSLTGGMADHRLRVKASDIGNFTAALALQIGEKAKNTSLTSLGTEFLKKTPHAEISSWNDWITGVADDLIAAQGKGIVLVGSGQSAEVQLLVFGINAALGNLGTTIETVATNEKSVSSLADLATAIKDAKVKTLFIFKSNPVYSAPPDFNLAKLIAEVPETLHLSLSEVETSKVCHWHVPAAHYLEMWGDTRSLDGTLCAIQPMVLPLWNGLSEIEILNALAGKPQPEGPALIKETFLTLSKDTSEAAWNHYLQQGFLDHSAWPLAKPSWNEPAAQNAIASILPPSSDVSSSGDFELVFLTSSSVYDGRYSGNAWLQETPDFVTKLTWDNALLMSPADAKRLGLTDGDKVRITSRKRLLSKLAYADEVPGAAGAQNLSGQTSSTVRAPERRSNSLAEVEFSKQSVEIAVLIAPGHANGSVSAAVGYGREGLTHVIDHVGFNVYPLRKDNELSYTQGISIESLSGKKYVFAQTQEHRNMEGRDLVREGTVQRYQKDPHFAQTMGMDAHIPPNIGLYTRPPFTASEQWGMSVDLNTCIGCNACLLACQAENNVPVVGKDQVRRGRDMAWIRIDRWFAGLDGSEDNPEMLPQAIMCQQCDNAPCETVCPVNATVHSEDGLNLMAYNRCIGTRYCANNCPWKVRRFNFFDYNQRPLDELYYGPLAPKGMADSLKMSKNPNVTVRMRGVMEKCTFCLQRIEEAKIGRLVKAGASDSQKTPLAVFKTACQQACPSESIVFGNIADPESKVSRLKESPRDYTMLKYLNARPRVTYLARIKNPNPKMPGADLVGLANGVPMHSTHEVHAVHDKESSSHDDSAKHADIGPTHFDSHGVVAPAPVTAVSKSIV